MLPEPAGRGPRRRITPMAVVMAMLAGATFCVVTWRVLDRNLDAPGPRPAMAAPALPARAGDDEQAETREEPQITVSPEAELAFEMTINSLRYYQPPPASERTSGGAAQGVDAAPDGAAQASETANSAQQEPLLDDGNEPAEQPSAPVEPAPQTEAQAASFRLTGVMRGPDGAVAIINGRFVKLGDSIGGAKVVRIGKYEVELQRGQEQFKIGM